MAANQSRTWRLVRSRVQPIFAADLGEIAVNAAREARATGVDPRAVAAALYVTRGGVPAQPRRGGNRRRELREQIAVLEGAIGELESEHPGVAPPVPRARRPARAGGPALLSASELEEVRVALVRRLASVQAAIDAHVIDVVEAATEAADASARRASPSDAPAEPARAAKRAPAKRAPAPSRRPASAKPARGRPGPIRPAVAEG